jgi:hypothetical protein
MMKVHPIGDAEEDTSSPVKLMRGRQVVNCLKPEPWPGETRLVSFSAIREED